MHFSYQPQKYQQEPNLINLVYWDEAATVFEFLRSAMMKMIQWKRSQIQINEKFLGIYNKKREKMRIKKANTIKRQYFQGIRRRIHYK